MFFKIQKTSTEAVQITKPLTTRFFIEYTSLEFLIKTKLFEKNKMIDIY